LQHHNYTLIADETFFHLIIVHPCKDKPQHHYPAYTFVNLEKQHVPLPVTFTADGF